MKNTNLFMIYAGLLTFGLGLSYSMPKSVAQTSAAPHVSQPPGIAPAAPEPILQSPASTNIPATIPAPPTIHAVPKVLDPRIIIWKNGSDVTGISSINSQLIPDGGDKACVKFAISTTVFIKGAMLFECMAVDSKPLFQLSCTPSSDSLSWKDKMINTVHKEVTCDQSAAAENK